MPFSSSQGKLFFEDWIRCFYPERVLDIGAGKGAYASILRKVEAEFERDITIDAIEIYEPYIDKFKLTEKYNNVIKGDVRENSVLEMLKNYDLIVMGDIVEHLQKEEMVKIWPVLIAKSKYIFISLPMKKGTFGDWYEGYIQKENEWKENIYEKHVYDWTWQEINDCLGPFDWVAPFITIVVLIKTGKG